MSDESLESLGVGQMVGIAHCGPQETVGQVEDLGRESFALDPMDLVPAFGAGKA